MSADGAIECPGLNAEEDFDGSYRAIFTTQLLDEGILPHLVTKYMRNRHLDTLEVSLLKKTIVRSF